MPFQKNTTAFFGMTQLRSESVALLAPCPMKQRLSESSGAAHGRVLLAQTQFGDQRGVALCVLGFEVVEQFASTADHAQQAATTVVVFGVCFEMGGQFIDACGQNGDLHFGAACVVGRTSVGLDDLGLV